jgi:hypothetical protein
MREQSFPLPWWISAVFVLSFALPLLFLYRFRHISRLTRIALWLLPWLPFLLLGFFVYGSFQPGFFMDDGPFWSRQHPIVRHVFPFLGLGSMTAFLAGVVLTIIAAIRRLFLKSQASA